MKNKVIDKDLPSIIYYPDDLIIGFDEFPKFLLKEHRKTVEQGGWATGVFVKGRKYPFGGIERGGRIVKRFKEKQIINISTNTGIAVIEPEVYRLIRRMKEREGEVFKLERTVWPKLARERKFHSCFLPENLEEDKLIWYPVNNEKWFVEAESRLGKNLNKG